MVSFSFIIGTNIDEEFTYHVVKVWLLFDCHKISEQRKLKFGNYMNVVDPLQNIEKLLGCLCLPWSIDKFYARPPQDLEPNKSQTEWFDIVELYSIQSVLQVVHQKYGRFDDVL